MLDANDDCVRRQIGLYRAFKEIIYNIHGGIRDIMTYDDGQQADMKVTGYDRHDSKYRIVVAQAGVGEMWTGARRPVRPFHHGSTADKRLGAGNVGRGSAEMRTR